MFKISEESIERFLIEMGEKDGYTRAHSERVGAFMQEFAETIKLPPSHALQMRLAGLLHDAGKLDTPKEILEKIGRGDSMSPEEKVEIGKHVEAEGRLARVGYLPSTIILAVRHHHESWDGKGFPDGLSGTSIPPSARMLAVCDVYDAVSSAKTGRRPVSPRRAVSILKKMAGVRLDPELTDIFICKIVKKNFLWTRVKALLLRLFGVVPGKIIE